MDDISIRTATAADHDEVGEVRRRSSLSNEGDRANLLANPETLVLDGAALHEGLARVAVGDDHVRGFTVTSSDDDALELEQLFVDPDWMRRGVGRALIADVVAAARQRGLTRISVTANVHALAFYEAVGFVVDGTVSTRFGETPHMRLDVDT